MRKNKEIKIVTEMAAKVSFPKEDQSWERYKKPICGTSWRRISVTRSPKAWPGISTAKNFSSPSARPSPLVVSSVHSR